MRAIFLIISVNESSEFIVQPKLFNYTDPIEPTTTPTTSSTTTPIPTVSSIPTNPPQKCQGNSEC
ncbi:hypothetical protein DDB_G0287181 [Dictyostelium discoideum AX4]|uniref:hypothetical protein n=1 Tax=Dictyostelium discoideum AX4 TaxID=352472 RepID=UPI00004E3E90|nr:hypothetical protein DDB_G0287181 [Dictyostelium discoideum AX4]EAL63865.1 hypothetical protein DDB_G0287181 [Dictyostelium discoideum AX4]|eukprot:XP_637381.1 hypothetical protein DDB_G0287181 [Dictyostelium discoideum AX4]